MSYPHDEEPTERPATRASRDRSADLLKVPEYPRLAPDVSLAGEMQGTGFQERQWLVQRGDRFVQVTEILYRIAERADGERTLGEIAEGVTGATDWMVSADNVRLLIAARLLPMGLISPADEVERSAAPHGRDRQNSPLGFLVRRRMLSPRVIDPITGILKVLYAPLVLIPLLVAVAFAHVWLYLEHGVSRGFVEVLYTPGLLLAVLAILLVAGVFHEFGHASALRYGGGRVRGMGAGLYIIYPAFYTDTTDSYRLGRWARVRTDLGGFYFHLVFALGLVALYAVTGWEFLLFVVLLINLDILCQCLPFVRFDGYWALADLTGIPDFFSQMGAFLRSVLPVPGWKGAKLPNLKPWVKGVFAGYVILTIPALSLLLFLLLTRAPRILMVVWDAFLAQMGMFSEALNGGELLILGASGSQMLILGIEMLGIAYYLLYGLGWRLVLAIWSWGGNLRRRFA